MNTRLARGKQIVHTEADHVEFGPAKGDRERRVSPCRRSGNEGMLIQTHVEIFQLDADVAPRREFDAAARRPARGDARTVTREAIRCRGAREKETTARGTPAPGEIECKFLRDAGISEAAGGIGEPLVRRKIAQAGADRSKPIDILVGNKVRSSYEKR